ncbi:hypothetical protein DFJ63DRAFT_186264 [Scheffersomyces coipomensis]|uniref:uncharacterized protein n=1 Tax=Scheffersomyces coipomensis TaxID=1788519 RepID=UPI00315DB74F
MSMYFKHLEQIINLKVKIITLLDEAITGHVFAYSTSNEVLVLKITDVSDNKNTTANNHNTHKKGETYRIINTAFIKNIQVIKKLNNQHVVPTPMAEDSLKLSPISISDLETSLQDSITSYKPEDPHLSLPQVATTTSSTAGVTTTTGATSPRSHSHSNNSHTNNNNPQPHHHKSPSKASVIATKLFDKLCKLYGVENIKWSGPGANNIIIFDEIKLSKPYTLGNKSIHKLNKSDSKYYNDIQTILKQFWLDVDNEKRGG